MELWHKWQSQYALIAVVELLHITWITCIPQIKVKNDYIGLNQVTSCPRCNIGRGNEELMEWYRQNMAFQSLGVLRRYLKLCYLYAKQRGYLDIAVEKALQEDMPFDPRNLPEKFPPVNQLVWDYAYLEAQGG